MINDDKPDIRGPVGLTCFLLLLIILAVSMSSCAKRGDGMGNTRVLSVCVGKIVEGGKCSNRS